MYIKIIVLSLVISCLAAAAVCMLLNKQQQKIAVIDAVKLANEYTMKKELEEIEKIKLLTISKQVDSVNELVQIARSTPSKSANIDQLIYTAEYFKNKFQESYTQSNNDINLQIWKRLNPALGEFGKSKGLHLIIGANGMGSVLYTDGFYDITNEALLFVNKKYEEGN